MSRTVGRQHIPAIDNLEVPVAISTQAALSRAAMASVAQLGLVEGEALELTSSAPDVVPPEAAERNGAVPGRRYGAEKGRPLEGKREERRENREEEGRGRREERREKR